jgi:hypothetical protein
MNQPDPRITQATAVKPPIEPVDLIWDEDIPTTFDKAQMDNHIPQQSSYTRFQKSLQDTLVPKMIEAMTRHYNNTDDKYSGEPYEDLNTKLLIFYDVCDKSAYNSISSHCILAHAERKRTKVLLDKGQGKTNDFRTMVGMMRAHFDTEENRQRSLTESHLGSRGS